METENELEQAKVVAKEILTKFPEKARLGEIEDLLVLAYIRGATTAMNEYSERLKEALAN